MKGFIQFLFAAIIVVGGIILVTAFSIQYNIIRIVDLQYRYNSAQTTLMALLPVTDSNNTPFIQLIGEKISQELGNFQSTNNNMNLSLLNQTLSNFTTPVYCYTLKSSTNVLIPANSGCNPQYEAFTKIPLPYNPSKLVDSITLVIN